MHLGNDALLADIRELWDQSPDHQPAWSQARGLWLGGQFALSTPDFFKRLRSGAAMDPPFRSS